MTVCVRSLVSQCLCQDFPRLPIKNRQIDIQADLNVKSLPEGPPAPINRVMIPKAVLFDFDGVIVDTEWAIYQAWARTYERSGHDLPLSLYTRCIGSDFATWSPKTNLEDLSGRTFDWEVLDESRQVEIREELANQGEMPGVGELLQYLDTIGIVRSVVSSSSHDWVDGWLEKLDLRQYFSHVICRGDAPRIKPAPDLYLEASSRLGINVADCLVLEDSLNGLFSATAAGMRSWAIPNRVTNDLDFSQAELVLPDLGSAMERLKQLRCPSDGA